MQKNVIKGCRSAATRTATVKMAGIAAFSPQLAPTNTGCCPLVVRLLSACCPLLKRTTSGHQADNKRTTTEDGLVKA